MQFFPSSELYLFAVASKSQRLPTDQSFDLPNGCVCISSGSGFVATLASLVKDADPFDYIVGEGKCK